MGDSQVQKDVVDELCRELGAIAFRIAVSVKDGVVLLRGHLESTADKRAVEEVARRVAGVRAVASQLAVAKLAPHTDASIAAACRAALEHAILVPHHQVTLSVSGGWVLLRGEVRWHYEKVGAENAVRAVPGVVGTSNLIKVVPRLPPEEPKARRS